MMKKSCYKADTLLSHLGRDPETFHGAVNTPVYHASTILVDCLETYEDPTRRGKKGEVFYGRYGTPTTFALEDTVAALEGGHGTVAVSSGLGAIACALLAFIEPGDHILVSDSAYLPTRKLCDGLLRRLGVETSYFDPRLGTDIAGLLRPGTRLILLESPGSLTFEMTDVPAVATVAREAGAGV